MQEDNGYKKLLNFYKQKLPSDLHVIALDLPGHGDSEEPPQNEDLSLTGLVDRVHQVCPNKITTASQKFTKIIN